METKDLEGEYVERYFTRFKKITIRGKSKVHAFRGTTRIGTGPTKGDAKEMAARWYKHRKKYHLSIP